jgi:hypothetical protein
MNDVPEPTYSTKGMECPYCAEMWSPDSPGDYDESGFDMTCDTCTGTFHVESAASWSWSCKPVKPPPDASS